MAFRGEYEHSLDSKGRLTIPSTLRDQLAGEIVLAKGPDPCLWLMPADKFEELSALYIAPHSPFSTDARRMRRYFNANAISTELDSAGRVRVDGKLAAKANLAGKCAVIGSGDYIEIWNDSAWQEESDLLDADFPEIAESMAGTTGTAT